MQYLRELFYAGYMPHGFCYLWQPKLMLLHAASDSGIAVAYFCISAQLYSFARRRKDMPYPGIIFMFGLFILGCGLTHAMEVWTLWHGTYWLSGAIKAVTAVASLATALALFWLVPKALALPGAGDLRKVNQELESFCYTISHDLRAPLRAMQGFATMALEENGECLNERGRSYLHRITAAAVRMDALVRDLLDYSSLGRNTLDLEPVDLAVSVSQTLAAHEKEVRGSAAEIQLENVNGTVLASATILFQILSNLLSNALKFAVPGQRPEVKIRVQEDGAWVRVWFEDHGIGIDPRYQARIFQPFERLNSQAEIPGTGIGLAIVRRGVEKLGGRVGVDSEPGHGSRFWVELQRG
jgi:signal transduction histidine kinase